MDNGEDYGQELYARISGVWHSKACQSLPPAETDTEDERSVTLDVPGIGYVVFTCHRKQYRHAKSYHRSWLVERVRMASADELS